MKKIILLILACFFILIIKSQTQIPPRLNCVKINHLYRKACHNCYEYSIVSTLKGALDLTRVIELDIHSHETNLTEAAAGKWYVRHSSTFSTNNKNNCGTGDQDFNICLEDMQQWSVAHAGHDPIVVFIDLKPKSGFYNSDFWRPNHRTQDLDNVLRQFALDMGGLDVVYKPSDLRGSHTTLREAAKHENWPSLGNLKNKFMFVLTGDNFHLNEYLVNIGSGSMAFVAINIDAFANASNGFIPQSIGNYAISQEIVFYNLKDNQTSGISTFIPANGLMSRVWDTHNNTSASQYGGSIYANVNNIAIKNINDNNLNGSMNSQLIDINNITIGGSSGVPHRISSKYDNILQSAILKVTAQNLIVEAGTHYNVRAGEEIDLLPGVDIRFGADTDISIGICSAYSDNLRSINTYDGVELLEQQIKHLFIDNQVITLTNDEDGKIVKEILLYPNPTTNSLNISFTNYLSVPITFTLNDITGRRVLTKNYQTQQEGRQKFSVSISSLNNGTYFYTLQVGQQTYNGKVVKMAN